MSFTVEQKNQLAKLLATENIRIEHKTIRTAMFDVKNRVLMLPIWKDMTGNLYDLLVGHEVGHALYTPSEGWHTAVADTTKSKSFKNFLNVVEDARIEKKIQRRYPGLRGSFKNAYKSLMDQDFFGIKDRNLNELPFIDKLNLFTKSQYSMDFQFNETELEFIEDVQQVESWEDVVDVATRIFEYSKKEQQEKELKEFDSDDSYEGGIDYGDQENDDYGDDESDTEQSDYGDNDLGDTPSKEFIDKNYDPTCETDKNYRNNENFLIDDKSKNYLYLNVPELDQKRMIVPAWVVHKQLTEYYADRVENGFISESEINEMVNSFKNKNERYVSLLAKEFEMNKAAKAFAKNRVADTGEIDINRLSSYKFDDNIFRKVTIVPKGKSHGLILLLDCSGSMTDNMAGSIEQILILSMFCRKVNIPFKVFGFNDSYDVCMQDKLAAGESTENIGRGVTSGFGFRSGAPNSCGFSFKQNDFLFGFCQLREYLNSTLSAAEYTKYFRNMILLYHSYRSRYSSYSNYIGRPASESLSNTPLISALIGCQKIILDFKKQNNLDLTNLIIVHDGDADSIRLCYNSEMEMQHIDPYLNNIYLCDKKAKYQKKLDYKNKNRFDPMLEAILDWFTTTTKSKIFGFFLIENSNHRINSVLGSKFFKEEDKELSIDWVERDDLRKQLKTEKYLRSYTPGYDQFFLIIGGNELEVQNEELEISGNLTQVKLRNAFMKMNKKKQVSRVFVNQFIKGIAA